MRILSIDSAGGGCGVCLLQDGAILSLAEEAMERGQDSRLIPLVQQVMREASCDYEALDRIAVTRGPGSFTGLRIGLAAARGLGLAAAKPVIGIDRFAVHAAQHAGLGAPLFVVLESRRLELYLRVYDEAGKANEPEMLAAVDIDALIGKEPGAKIAGDAFDNLRGLIDPAHFLPRTEPEAVTSARLAAQVALPLEAEYLPRPLYLRAPDVTIKKQEGLCV